MYNTNLGQQNRAAKSAQLPLFSSFKHQNPVFASICVTAYSALVAGSTRFASTPIGSEQMSYSPKEETVSKSPVPAGLSRLRKADLKFFITVESRVKKSGQISDYESLFNKAKTFEATCWFLHKISAIFFSFLNDTSLIYNSHFQILRLTLTVLGLILDVS